MKIEAASLFSWFPIYCFKYLTMYLKMRKHSAQLVQIRSKAIHMVVKYAKQPSSHLTCACGGCRSGGSDPVVSMWMRWMGGPAMLPVMVMLGETVLPINTSFVSFSSCSTRITSSFSEKRPHPYGISWGSIQCFTWTVLYNIDFHQIYKCKKRVIIFVQQIYMMIWISHLI